MSLDTLSRCPFTGRDCSRMECAAWISIVDDGGKEVYEGCVFVYVCRSIIVLSEYIMHISKYG